MKKTKPQTSTTQPKNLPSNLELPKSNLTKSQPKLTEILLPREDQDDQDDLLIVADMMEELEAAKSLTNPQSQPPSTPL